MWWNKKEEPVQETVAVAEPEVHEEPAPEEPEPEEERVQWRDKDVLVLPFGTKLHGLTQFGDTWINLDDVSVIEFCPPDGCGAEVRFRDGRKAWHISDDDAYAMSRYFESFKEIKQQVDSAAQGGTCDK